MKVTIVVYMMQDRDHSCCCLLGIGLYIVLSSHSFNIEPPPCAMPGSVIGTRNTVLIKTDPISDLMEHYSVNLFLNLTKHQAVITTLPGLID